MRATSGEGHEEAIGGVDLQDGSNDVSLETSISMVGMMTLEANMKYSTA